MGKGNEVIIQELVKVEVTSTEQQTPENKLTGSSVGSFEGSFVGSRVGSKV